MQQSDDTIHERIRRVELYTRRLLSGALVGSSRSAQKGVGIDFDQLREYVSGDDPRIINWFASARSQRLLVKQYQEERNRTIILIVDGSRSMEFGVNHKFERALWITSVISMIGAYGADKVGLIIYTDTVELYVPPRSGIMHVRSMLTDVYAYTPKKRSTNMSSVLPHLGAIKERALVFVISDCIDDMFAHTLRHMKKQDVVLIKCSDVREETLPTCGILTIQDTESNILYPIHVNHVISEQLGDFLQERHSTQNKIAKSAGVTVLYNTDKKTFIHDLLITMRRRMRY